MKTSVLLKFLSLPVLVVMLFAVGLGTVGASVGSTPVSGDGVVPTQVDGNPNCESLGYENGFKINLSPNGTFTFTNPPGELTSGAIADPYNSVTISNSNNYTFSWSATLGIDAVIVKGGQNGANSYVYIPEDKADTGLGAPPQDNGNPPTISHIEFCYDYEVTVSKTADTSFTRTFDWSITKSVSPSVLNLFTGDSGTVGYSVAVTKTGYTDSAWAVTGEITIDNDTPLPATISGVADSISGVGDVTPDCGVTLPYVLPAWGTLTCTYQTPLPDGTNRTNTATVTTTGQVGGGSATAPVVFGDPTTTVNDTITVADTNIPAGLGTTSVDRTFTYDKTFTCDANEGVHNNTATIVETGQSASASVTVNCYELTVTKDADTSLTRTWNWTIDKTGDQTDLTLALGQQFLVNYTVVVDATSADSAWAVAGNISVNNPAPIAATLTGVSDIVSPNIAANVNCGVVFPYSLAAGGTLNCSYTASLPDATSRTNTATATIQNSPSGTTSFTGSANVSFANPTVTQVDECIDVEDDLYGVLGTVCADDAPVTFTYSMYVGPYDVCGDYTFVNVASFVTNDTGATGSDSHTVDVNVPCATGCTLTQGYWKTHSLYGPAPYDDAWLAIGPAGADTLFFNTGKTWYTIFWTPPAGNAFYNLAHQYMAAKLNIMNGASQPAEVFSAIAQAEAIFNGLPAGSTTLSKAQRTMAMQLASTLDKYNNGLIGPGHCSE